MIEGKKLPGQLVFGLDIGTRSIVGTVGYQAGDKFYVVTQSVREHKTRAMLDGQIHDIYRVGETIGEVKAELEGRIGRNLKDVCIAAAGRVLQTVTIHVDSELEAEKEINGEDVYALDSMGVEKAYKEFLDNNELDMKFYCVGYSVVRYYMNGYPIGNLEGHRAKEISADIIATFLPEDVVDGLYKAVSVAGLEVVNLTLEPIAAIQVAIPEMYRMLNIALVDVGAGTSDISITKDGSIVAYGMIPIAGDSLTEVIAKHCLVDFVTAERIKRGITEKDQVEYKDIMGLPQTITAKEVAAITEEVIADMTKQVADKIKELNGDKSVSAVFVVGGGGKITGYTQALAEQLGIQKERVAVRGEEVMQSIEFLEEDANRDSLMVTPIGICLSFYEKSNNFVFVTFNEQRIKLYDNNKLAVVDAAMQAEFANDGLFPKRGKELNYIVNGKAHITRGALGEAAVITVNGKEGDIYTQIHANDQIQVKESTAGEAAELTIDKLPEFGTTMRVIVNEKQVDLPKFASVNGQLQSGYYSIQEGDVIEILDYYTVRQIAEFMDVIVDRSMNIYVNNKQADMDTRVYEKFSVLWTMENTFAGTNTFPGERNFPEEEELQAEDDFQADNDFQEMPGVMGESSVQEYVDTQKANSVAEETTSITEERKQNPDTTKEQPETAKEPTQINVTVNQMGVTLSGKAEYVFVDVFSYIDFDLSTPKGKGIVTKLNGRDAQYMEMIHNGDIIEIYWKQ